MNLADISKLNPLHQQQAMADQARATAARERIFMQMQVGKQRVMWSLKQDPESFTADPAPSLPCLPAKSPPEAISAAMQAILPQCPGVKVKHPKVSETHMQQQIIRWWKLTACDWQLEEEYLMAIPNQGKRHPKTASRMIAEGLRSGVPDLFLAVPRGDCGGLWCELKTTSGVLSENQRFMLARLANVGYATVVCRSAEEAIAAITCYLNLPTPSKS
jgi:hypothetical protein